MNSNTVPPFFLLVVALLAGGSFPAGAESTGARLFDMDREFTVARLRNFSRTTYEYEQAGRALVEGAKRAALISSSHWLSSSSLAGDLVHKCGDQVNRLDEWDWIRYKGSLPDDQEVVIAVTTKTINELVACLQGEGEADASARNSQGN